MEICTEICTFGEHLTLDGYGGSFGHLNDAGRVRRVLGELPRLLVMRPLAEPTVRWAEPNDSKDPGGWSGYVLIAESHISVHTFPHRRFLSADVYTCREGTDTAQVARYFTRMFDLADVELNFFKRGTKYPVHNLVSGSAVEAEPAGSGSRPMREAV